MNNTLLVVVKFIVGVLLLPVVWATAVLFHQHVEAFPGTYGEFFLWGVFSYLMLFLFFHHFWGLYDFGQKIFSGAFQLASPANGFIAKIVPFYLTLILLGFCVTTKLLDINTYDHYFMFFAGFAFTMHIILTAQDLQSGQKMFLKPEYLFIGSIVFILLVFMVILLFDLALGEFTIPDFARSVWNDALDIYYLIGQKFAVWE